MQQFPRPREEIDEILSKDGPENVRFLQRALRNAMTEHAGVVRDEAGLLSGLRELAEIEERLTDVGVHPDIAGFYDLAHAFDLKSLRLPATRQAAQCQLGVVWTRPHRTRSHSRYTT
jgi:succinate dehydrogenase / fumarate reductase flavoprotein subunit